MEHLSADTTRQRHGVRTYKNISEEGRVK